MTPNSIDEKMNQIKDKVTALRYKVEGCTEEEIELLKQEQGVDFVPEMYRQIMLVMGKEGVSRILLGSASCKLLEEGVRENFEMTLKSCGVACPKDYFLIMEHAGYQFFFLRTRDRLDDPPVWGQWEDNYFYKLGDSLSSFILDELEPDREKYNDRWKKLMSTIYYYDPEQDDFYGKPNPDTWL